MKRESIISPMSGTLLSLDKVSDELFASGTLGKGIAVAFDGTELLSPIDGMVIATFPTGHAYIIRREDGLEVLLHVGVDSAKLPEAFDCQVRKYQKVSKGQLLSRIRPELFAKDKAFCPVVFSIPDVEVLLDAEGRRVEAGEEALRIIW